MHMWTHEGSITVNRRSWRVFRTPHLVALPEVGWCMELSGGEDLVPAIEARLLDQLGRRDDRLGLAFALVGWIDSHPPPTPEEPLLEPHRRSPEQRPPTPADVLRGELSTVHDVLGAFRRELRQVWGRIHTLEEARGALERELATLRPLSPPTSGSLP